MSSSFNRVFWNTAQVKCRSAGMGPICGTHGEQPSNPTRTVVILVTNKWIILGSLGIDPYLGRRKVKGITSKSPLYGEQSSMTTLLPPT